MTSYLLWDEKTITDFSDDNINALYDAGYVFTRKGKGIMTKTRSVRIDLSRFELSSENRRILRKTEMLNVSCYMLHDYPYHWSIGKMAKDFYETKFGAGTFSANKVKELLTEPDKSNFNRLFVYSVIPTEVEESRIGYSIALETLNLIHYAYPFYQLQTTTYNLPPDTGLGMMLRAILYAKEHGKKYIYIGSAQRPTDTYKLQFAGLEWWDNKEWKNNLEELKALLK